MKEGWELKKLCEVAVVAAGQGAPQGDGNYCSDGIPFIKAGNLESLINGMSEHEVQNVSDVVAKSHRLKLYKAGSVLFAKSGMSCMKGWVYTLKHDCYVVSHLAIITPHKQKIESRYLNYYFQFYKPNTLVKDAAYPSISLKDIENMPLLTPPLPEQQHIVEELDLLSSIIEKKKAQLNELDNLAQSLFYEMFGDPITNDKGWEKKCLSELCGRVNNIRWQEVLDEKTYNYVDLTAVDRTSHCIEETTMIKKGDAPSRAKQIIRTNDVLFGTTRPTLKRVCLVNKEYNDSICSTGFCVLRPLEDFVSSKWLFHLLLSNSFYSYIEPLQSGASYPAVSDNIVKSFSACIPPIILQNQFASKIEAVEHQKELIKQSIKEVETLFNSRMDYYFN